VTQKLTIVLVAAAGGTCSVALAGPKGQPVLPPVQVSVVPPQLIMPLGVARAKMVNGKIERDGPWMPYVGSGPDTPTVPVFDAFEPDAAGAPTGFCTSGCNQNNNCPAAPAGSRWYRGTAFINPNDTNDMTVGAGFNGVTCAGTEFAWFWGGAAATLRHCVIAVATAEDFNDCPSGMTGGSNYFPGVMFDFGMLAGGGGHYTNADLTANMLFFTMPADGSGAYTIQLQTDDPANPGQLVLDPTGGNQPFLWGTGDGETPPDGRVGHNGPNEWVDSTAPYGGGYAPTECVDQTQGTNFCPNPWCATIIFLTEPGAATGACCIPSAPCQVVTPDACAALNGVYQGDNTTCAACGPTCYPNCDNSTTVPCLNVQDFGCFLNRFAGNDTYANCDNSTTPPVLNVQDFGCFLNQFASGCSGC
jgi:hypothetical protein